MLVVLSSYCTGWMIVCVLWRFDASGGYLVDDLMGRWGWEVLWSGLEVLLDTVIVLVGRKLVWKN